MARFSFSFFTRRYPKYAPRITPTVEGIPIPRPTPRAILSDVDSRGMLVVVAGLLGEVAEDVVVSATVEVAGSEEDPTQT